MANWKGGHLTAKGRALSAKVEAGTCTLRFTKMKVGDGEPSNLDTLTDLAGPKQVIGISNCTPDNSGVCTVEGILTNQDVKTGYYLRELGLFAQDPDMGEILYAISTDANPDYWQPAGSSASLAIALRMQIAITNADSVTAVLNPSGLLVQKDLEAHDTDKNAHANLIQVTTTANKPASMADRGLWVEIKG